MCDDFYNWPTKPTKWDVECINLLDDKSKSSGENISVEKLIESSNKFPMKFPIDTARCETLLSTVNRDIIQRNINSVYPVIHESALFLYSKFILFKRKFGTNVEKKLYQNMSVVEFVDRLLTKRAVTFIGRYDLYILIDNNKGSGDWETIGKDNEKSPLILKNCLSYDEIKLSAFLSVSSYSYFINNGSRKNKGIPAESRESIEDEGVIIGLIGARLKRQNVMEYQEIVITKTQNSKENGYGGKIDSIHKLFADFYEEPCFQHKDAIKKWKNDKIRFKELYESEILFDNVVFAKRLILSFDTLLLEANSRASEVSKDAYIHVVGIGLGVWKISDHQKEVFVTTFMNRLSILGSKLSNVSDVDFAYFGDGVTNPHFKDGLLFELENHPKNGVKIHVSKRQPHTKIESGKLLVVSYAWDGNALPGNEFWEGSLGSSGDSAAAASTQIAEIHNPHINPRVCAANMRIITDDGLQTFEDFINKLKNK